MNGLRWVWSRATKANLRPRQGARCVQQAVSLAAFAAMLLPLAGCGSFFQCENKPACPASTDTGSDSGSGSTVDFAFVSYTNTDGTSVISGYNIATGALTPINTVTLSFHPVAMVVNPKNSILYVASVPGATTPGVYEYTIGTDGTLTAANNGVAIVQDLIGAMAISPDGNYLYTMESAGQTMIQYGVDATTGGLTSQGGTGVLATNCVPTVTTPVLPVCSITVSPAGDYVMASYGTQGDLVFSYNSTSGITNTGTAITPSSASTGDFSVAIDKNGKAYIGQTATISAYTLSTLIANPTTYTPAVYTYPSGSIPRSVVVDSTGSFVYSANVGTSKIGGFSTATTTTLPTLANQPYAGPTNVAALGIDSTNTYLIAAGYDASAGVQLYSIAGTGVLTSIKSAGTSTATQYPVLVAMSH